MVVKDEQAVKEYVIIDNVLRRHLSTEQKYILIAELSKVYETSRKGMTYNKSEDNLSSEKKLPSNDDVLVRTAKATGVNEKTVQRAREYSRLVKESPQLKKEKV